MHQAAYGHQAAVIGAQPALFQAVGLVLISCRGRKTESAERRWRIEPIERTVDSGALWSVCMARESRVPRSGSHGRECHRGGRTRQCCTRAEGEASKSARACDWSRTRGKIGCRSDSRKRSGGSARAVGASPSGGASASSERHLQGLVALLLPIARARTNEGELALRAR